MLPPLNKLGTAAWQKTTARSKAAVQELARDLLRHYAMRKGRPGHAFGTDVVWQQELEASFIYEDTEDQLRATEEIKRDMGTRARWTASCAATSGSGRRRSRSARPSRPSWGGSRWPCSSPTTILAQQHLTTFRDRLAEYPVVIDVLSRFRTGKEQDDVIGRLKEGKVDIVIGTHRLVQKDVEFWDLGLLVIDEEQQFECSQGDDSADAVVRGRPHADGHADPAHPVHVTHGRARSLRDQHASAGPAPGAHGDRSVQRRAHCGGGDARGGPGRSGVLRAQQCRPSTP